jgi:hypothetical protein
MNAKPKTEIHLPQTIEAYLRAINARDEAAFASSFHQNAIVEDVGRTIHGIAAITEWARREIFAVNVTLELLGAAEREGQTITTVKVDGTFDRTGLPDVLVMDHCITLAGGRITALTCRLASARPDRPGRPADNSSKVANGGGAQARGLLIQHECP